MPLYPEGRTPRVGDRAKFGVVQSGLSEQVSVTDIWKLLTDALDRYGV